MAKPHVERLAKKYPRPMAGANYRGLMEEIIAANHEGIQGAVARVKRDEFGRALARIKRSTTKQIAIPDLAEVLPKRSIFLRKGAEQGRVLTETLRDRLTSDLRESVADFLKTGKGSMQYKTGERRGEINPELVTQLRKKMSETFSGYRKAGPGGIPKNIQVIADTEARSAISDIKHSWAVRLEETNPGKVRVMKTWRAHPRLSKIPRGTHGRISGQKRPLGIPFLVPTGDKRRPGGVDLMQHPHDPAAPAEQVISCHCECIYETVVL